MKNNSLGSRIKELRKQNNMTQVELGKRSGIHHTNIGRIENKGAMPQADILFSIANSLGTTVSWLLTGEAFPNTTDNPGATDHKPNSYDSKTDEINQLIQQLTENEKNEVIIFIKYLIFHNTSKITSSIKK